MECAVNFNLCQRDFNQKEIALNYNDFYFNEHCKNTEKKSNDQDH